MSITYSEEEIYPNKAREYLAGNIANRPLRKQTVSRYAKDMKSGKWDMNGEDLTFDWNGHLRNGQHRLNAVIEADVPVKFGVKRGVDPSTFRTMDNNVSRSPGDVMATLGHKNGNQIAAATRLIMAYESNRRVSGGSLIITKTELIEFFERHPYIGEAVKDIHTRKYLLATAPLAAVRFLANNSRRYDEQWNNFLDAFYTGANLSSESPVLLLRNWAVNKKAQGNVSGEVAFVAIARAWNAFVSGSRIKHITSNSEMNKIPVFGFLDKDSQKPTTIRKNRGKHHKLGETFSA